MSEISEKDIPELARQILHFWFTELEPEQWWKRDDGVDAAIAVRFGAVHQVLSAKIAPDWLETPKTRLAAVIVLDQFSRNLHRDDPRAFANDAMALALAKQTIELGLDEALTKDQRVFLYVPFQHSEDAHDQERSVELYAKLDHGDTLDFANKHKLVIDRFGRFPHRNDVLGRETTPEEREFIEKESWFW